MLCNSRGGAGTFLARLTPGTPVVIQYNGGGSQGLLTGTFQGFSGQGFALFADATLGGVALPGLTRIDINAINSVSV